MDVNSSESARRHVDDAECLRKEKRIPNADQLYGIAVECALKAIMVGLGAPTRPSGDLAEQKHWKHLPELWAEFQGFPTGRAGARYLSVLPRDNLKMVAAQVPETEATAYLERFTEASYRLFQENIYEESGPGDLDAFNYDLDESEAPHVPLRINWTRAMQQFDPVRRPASLTRGQVDYAFDEFIKGADLLAFSEELIR